MTDAVAPSLHDTLGQVRVVSNEDGRAVIEYQVGPHMCHSGGVAQGGFVCGWIDAAMAHASLSLLPDMTPMSLELKVSYFAPARPGRVVAEGWIERRGRATCFAEGRLLRRGPPARPRRQGPRQGQLHHPPHSPRRRRGQREEGAGLVPPRLRARATAKRGRGVAPPAN